MRELDWCSGMWLDKTLSLSRHLFLKAKEIDQSGSLEYFFRFRVQRKAPTTTRPMKVPLEGLRTPTKTVSNICTYLSPEMMQNTSPQARLLRRQKGTADAEVIYCG